MTQTASRSSLKESADRIRAQYIAAVNAGDIEAAAGIFAAESVFLPPGQPPLEGIPAIRAWFSHVVGQFTITSRSTRSKRTGAPG